MRRTRPTFPQPRRQTVAKNSFDCGNRSAVRSRPKSTLPLRLVVRKSGRPFTLAANPCHLNAPACTKVHLKPNDLFMKNDEFPFSAAPDVNPTTRRRFLRQTAGLTAGAAVLGQL